MIKKVSDHEVFSTTTERWYRTDKHGMGLWISNGYEERQVLGTCQFSIAGLKHPIAKLKREARAREEWIDSAWRV